MDTVAGLGIELRAQVPHAVVPVDPHRREPRSALTLPALAI